MEEIKKGFVAVPKATMSALKGLLFGSEGTNLTSIIEDLGNDDLTAINVGLVFKGLKPSFEGERVRYSSGFRSYSKYEFESYSLILGTIRAKKTTYDLGRDNETVRERPWEIVSLSPIDWEMMTETETEVREIMFSDKR